VTIEVHALSRISVLQEADTDFASDLTSSGTYLDVPIVEGSAEMTLTTEQVRPETLQQFLDAQPTNVLGPKSASMTFEVHLHPTGVAGTDAQATVDATDTAIVLLLKTVLGGVSGANNGTTVDDAAPTASSFDVADTTDLDLGGALGWVNGDGRLEVREIEQVSSSTVTLKQAYSAAPADDDVLYASTTVYLTEDPDTSLQFQVQGAEQDDRWLLLGGQLESMSLTTELGQLPRVSMTIQFADWIYGDDANTDLTGSELVAADYANFDPVAFFDSEFLAQVVNNSTRQIIDAPTFEVSPNISYVPVSSPSGTNNIARWRRTRSVPAVNFNFTTYFENFSWFDARDNRDLYHFQVQVGGSGGGGSSVTITVPTAQVTNAQRVAAEDLAGTRVESESQLDQGCSNQGLEIRRSAFRIHWV